MALHLEWLTEFCQPQLLSAEVVLCMHKTTILCQFGLFCHQLTTISPPILNHFWWELYHFNPKPIYPELDDSEQLTGEPIHPYLSLVGQLQRPVTLGCLVIHAQVMALPMLRSTPRQLQGIYGYVKKPIISNWIQSNHYLSDMLSKHWDL